MYRVQIEPAWVRSRTLIPSGAFMMDSVEDDEFMRLVVFLAVPVPD
jgi:hypothetical protein